VQGGTAAEPMMQIGSPLFDSVRIQLSPKYYSGKVLEIATQGDVVGHDYLQSIRWDGRELKQCSIPWTNLINGGRLELSVGEKPRTEWK
jgi:Putative alpha-1,2-mannosidase